MRKNKRRCTKFYPSYKFSNLDLVNLTKKFTLKILNYQKLSTIENTTYFFIYYLRIFIKIIKTLN